MIDFEQLQTLRRGLTEIALKRRDSVIGDHSRQRPLELLSAPLQIEGSTESRLRIILASSGCIAATCTMCGIPNEAFRGRAITSKDLLAQFSHASTAFPLNHFTWISIYNSGNWFVDREIPAEVRAAVYRTIASSDCKGIMVESLPHFVNENVLREAHQHLGGKKLIVGMGLQSADDLVRNLCINTTCSKTAFERASDLLRKWGAIPKVYLMLKPPFLTEGESLHDALSSLRYLSTVGYRETTLCPTRIEPNTVVSELAREGLFTPPSLWTLVEVLRRARIEAPSVAIRVSGISKGNDESAHPATCEQCAEILRAKIAEFNNTQDLQGFCGVNCGCEDKSALLRERTDPRPVPERVHSFIQRMNFGDMKKS